MLLAMFIGAFWEFIEFGTDWFSNADLQKSNGDTITDIVANNTGAFVATMIALALYTHVFSDAQRRQMGEVAAWLAHGPRALVVRHGRPVGALVCAAVGGLIFASQWVDRGEPALASGLASGQSQTWSFVQNPTANTLVLSGDWVPDGRGICRENLEHPKPGSEKMGVLQLEPGTLFGDQPFRVQARYFEQRPSVTEGSEMDAGIAFGIRDANDFDLVEQNALHDILRLDHFIHDNRRDLREALFRTHGNEWHELDIDVSGSSVTAGVDGQALYSVDKVPNTSGGIGLWARAAAATCFSDASVTVGSPSGSST
jgi:hypothetical protein